MATSRSSHLKEKVTSSSSTPSTTTGRRSPRPPGSPNRQLSTTPDKPTIHNYLKSKSSISANPKSTAPKSTTTAKPTIRKSTDIKPPSPVRRPERTLSAPKPRSPSPLPRPSRTGISHALDRTKGAAARTLTKSSSTVSGRSTKSNAQMKRSKSLEKRKEIVAAPSAFVEVKDEVEENHETAAEESNEAKQVDILVIEHEAEAEAEAENEAENEKEVINDEAAVEESKQDEAVVEESPKMAEAEAVSEPAATTRGVVGPKKEAQRSNDVIEEAKSKFLEKRKNKVLALVGAFETVMALQEPDGQQQPKKDKEVDESADST